MPPILTNLECLANLPQYKTEKPYGALLTNGKDLASKGHDDVYDPGFWVEDQTPEDVLIMTQYDSHPDGDARYCPHISFVNERAPADAPPRRSVETRSIVISKRKESA